MTSVVFGFLGEGQRDYDFLPIIIRRALERLLPTVDVLGIRLNNILTRGRRQDERMRDAAAYAADYNFIVVHLDADGSDTRDAFEDRFRPGQDAIRADPKGLNTNLLPIIPVRTTDAWLLVDFEAFRAVVGTPLRPDDLGFPDQPRQVERIRDPKAALRDAVQRSRQGRRAVPIEEIYTPIAERLSLERLDRVPAFQEFHNQLSELLTALHLL
ncbi:MAG: DUF4276 family protein [Anaerolineae bacterium]|nr:DUF4276 family protein [Anaerolineae bacterium]